MSPSAKMAHRAVERGRLEAVPGGGHAHLGWGTGHRRQRDLADRHLGQQRAVARGEAVPSEYDTRRDVDAVLAAMQTRPAWFEKYIERPLGRKQAPLHTAPSARFDAAQDPVPLELAPLDQRDEAALVATAAAAVEQIVERVERGEAARVVVADVLSRAFADEEPAEGLDQVPGAPPSDIERARHMIADPAALERIVCDVVAALKLSPEPFQCTAWQGRRTLTF